MHRTAFALALLLCACGDPAPAEHKPPQPGDVLLKIDGIEITFGEVLPYVQFLDVAVPEGGQKTKIQKVLQDFTVPLRLAQRAFPAERAKQRERAVQLRSVAANVQELEQQGAQQVIKQQRLTRSQSDLPIVMFLFDPLTTRGTSDPIEVPRGFVVCAAHELSEAPAPAFDLVDAVLVGFLTHTPGDWETWKQLEQERIADKATYIHPDYREAMPTWLKLP